MFSTLYRKNINSLVAIIFLSAKDFHLDKSKILSFGNVFTLLKQQIFTLQVTGDVKKKTEPKPMIDNPNASATKKSNLIRPMPLKMPETEQQDGKDDIFHKYRI